MHTIAVSYYDSPFLEITPWYCLESGQYIPYLYDLISVHSGVCYMQIWEIYMGKKVLV